MANGSTECEIFLVIDENGEYAVGVSSENAAENYREAVGDSEEQLSMQHFCLKLTLPTPPAIISLAATVQLPVVPVNATITIKEVTDDQRTAGG